MTCYDLRAGPGPEIPSLAGLSNALLLPPVFKQHKPLLAGPDRSRPGGRDIVLNLLGFVPYGLALVCWMRHVRRWSCPRAVLAAALAGALVSLVIELIQVHLPTRDSSLDDLLCNAAGTLLGACLACRVRQPGLEVPEGGMPRASPDRSGPCPQ
jgi:VanZ family protein